MDEGSVVAEEAYAESLREPLDKTKRIGQVDIVVGITFRNEADTIGHVCRTVAKGLAEFFPDRKCVIVCAGADEGTDALRAVTGLRLRQGTKVIAFLMKNKRVSGKVWTLRAVMEIADSLNSDLAVFEADLKTRELKAETEGLTPEWVRRLLIPIHKEGMDLVIPKFNRHYLDAPASAHLVCPLLSSVFNLRVGGIPGGILGISSKLLKIYMADASIWSDKVSEHGIDSLLITAAIVDEAKICESSLGVRIDETGPEEETAWGQQARVIFEQVSALKDWWRQKGEVVYPLVMFGAGKDHLPGAVALDPIALIKRYKRGFNEFQGLYRGILSREAAIELRKMAGTDSADFGFSVNLWAEIVHDFLISYCLEQEFTKENILKAFVPICYGREAGFALELGILKERLMASVPDEAERLASLVAEWQLRQQTEEFIRRRPGFLARYLEKEKALEPILPMVTYRQFIPGVPLVVPKAFTTPAGETVRSDGIYESILGRYREEFQDFVRDTLKISPELASAELAQALKELMLDVENSVNELLLT
ncbi:MAG: hypothetical protein V3S51_01810, partial [Dehalococcoidia bacterium]